MSLAVQGATLATEALDALVRACDARAVHERAPGVYILIDGSLCKEFIDHCRALRLDWAQLPERAALSDFGLFITDMDSTLINIECIDEIAAMQGLREEVSRITESAMRGEIDFTESLNQRVQALAGLPEQALEAVYTQRLRLNPGAERLLTALKAAGLHTVLVSGGFTYFTERLRQRLGFDEAYANELDIADGRLTGRIRGPVIDGVAKTRCLLQTRQRLGLRPEQVIAAGDGANDMQMLTEAGFAVAYRGKPVLREVADCWLEYGGLDGILNFLPSPANAKQSQN